MITEYYSYHYIDEMQYYKIKIHNNGGYSDDGFIYELFQYDYAWDLIHHHYMKELDYSALKKKLTLINDGFYFELMVKTSPNKDKFLY